MQNTTKTSLSGSFTFIYVTAAVAFLVLLAMDAAGLGRTVMKAIPVSTLLIYVLRDMQGTARICLAGALFGSVCGDILLDLPGANLFVFGLVAFLVGHIFYTVLFFLHAKRPDRSSKVIIAGLVIFAGAMIWLFRGITPELYGPVVAYIAVIITMSIGALLVPAANRLLFGGALLFIASDVVLAVNKFLIVVPYGRLINITLYFLAQYMIIKASAGIWIDTSKTGTPARRSTKKSLARRK